METPDITPSSNADIVALNIVMKAIVGEVNSPGESLAKLLDRMASISRNVGGDYRAANADWEQTVPEMTGDSEIKDLVNRQGLAIGDTWAQHWMLLHLAKHLYEELESQCLASPPATAIEKIEYNDDGGVVMWSVRSGNNPES